MNDFDDTETTEYSIPVDDKLLFLNGRERQKFFAGKQIYKRKKNKFGSVIQYLQDLIRF